MRSATPTRVLIASLRWAAIFSLLVLLAPVALLTWLANRLNVGGLAVADALLNLIDDLREGA